VEWKASPRLSAARSDYTVPVLGRVGGAGVARGYKWKRDGRVVVHRDVEAGMRCFSRDN